MRVLFITAIISLFFATNLFAQTPLVKRHFDNATEAAKRQNYRKALKLYEKSLQISTANSGINSNNFRSKIYFNIGVCFYQLNKFTEAEKSFSQSIILSSVHNSRTNYFLGLTQIELNKLKNAKKSLKKAIKLNEQYGEAWFDLGMVLIEEKKYRLANIAFFKAIKFKSIRKDEAINNIGVVYALQGKLELAKREFQKAFIKSDGKLLIAKANFEFCKRYGNNEQNLFFAKLRFTNQMGVKNG